MRAVLGLCLLLAGTQGAAAAAWAQPRGHWQIIASMLTSEAARSYDSSGHAVTPKMFQRTLLQTDIAYGLSNRTTLFARTETAYVRTRDPGAPLVTAQDNAAELGLRYRLVNGVGLLAKDDVLSVELSARSAGAFNFAVSANAGAGGYDGGVRLLYGSGFRLFKRDGFVNAEIGGRWLSPPRPDQVPLDLTIGLWMNKRNMIMLQSFNLVSGPAERPYNAFRSHKLQASSVWRISKRLALQSGVFFSPAGRNALDEQGAVLSLWVDL